MRVPLVTKAASLFGAVALAGGGLLLLSDTARADAVADTARADDGRTFDCQMIYVIGDGASVEGYDCGQPTTYDGPGRVRYFNGTGGWTCKNISVRPDPGAGAGAVSVLKATGCTSVDHPGPALFRSVLSGI
ncbi:hypothetical protein OHS59_02600 [Streptomyces sp. NBC_00414]|uniref:hypothetical protein n=1 Tax=Streptomyces sp. NBC_00414 TaxID=2975739 RepID=UPI002E1A8662